MTDHVQLLQVSFKAERSASRKLARANGMAPDAALHAILVEVAGPGGLAQLVARRLAAQACDANRLALRDAAKASALAVKRARREGPASDWRAWFDGSAHPNPGRCGIGGLLTGPGVRIEISQGAGYGNSSEAEYCALIAVLRAALDANATHLVIFGDSRVVVDDINGARASASLSHLRAEAVALMARLEGASLHWIPRHRNPEADALSQRGVLLTAPEYAPLHPDA